MSRRGRKLAESDDNDQSGTSSTASSLDPKVLGRPSSPKPSFREKSSSFIRELFSHSRNNSSTSLNVAHNSILPSVVTTEIQPKLSDPIAASIPLPSIDISPSPPPEQSRIRGFLLSTARRDRNNLSPDGRPRVEDVGAPAISEGTARGLSRKDVLRTAYNGFKQILDIAAESADVFPPLKSVLGGLRATIKALELNSNNKKDLVALLDRMSWLETLDFSETLDAKLVARNRFLPKLRAISLNLYRISEQNVLEMALNAAQDEKTIAGLVSDVADALAEHQTAMLHSSLKMSLEMIDNDQRAQLNQLPHAKDAGFRSGNRRSCLEGTRKDVLHKIMSWARDLDDLRVFWLCGNAGSGKSTIGQTFAEQCSADGLLGASFFCSRNFQDRSNLDLIFPTLALQLAYRHSTFKDALIPIIKKSPNPGHESLTSQLETLVIAPLKASGVSTIIVIDAIDECRDDKSTSALLSVLERHIHDLSLAKIFITGRPESRIQSGFNLRDLKAETDVFLLHEVKKTSVDDDIRLYLRSQLSELVQSRTDVTFPDPWPDATSLESLVQRAGGLFIFASTTCKLLSSEFHSPIKLLQLVLSSPLNTGYEGQLELDALYTQILTENFKSSCSPFDVSTEVKSILGTVVVAPNPVLLETLAILLGKDVDETQPLLRSLESVIRVPVLPNIPITPFHKSFPDYLLDTKRCPDSRFHVDAPEHHARLAIRCLELMQQRLKRNICDLPRYSMNDETKDLAERRSKFIGDALEYVCTSWGHHLSQASRSDGNEATLVQLMTIFMLFHFLSWLEVLSIGGNLRTAVYFLRDAKIWFSQIDRNTKLLESIEDGERFVLTFFDAIEVSASHIYESAVLLSPTNSIIRKCYNTDPRRSWNAIDDAWDACIRKIDIECGRCIAFSHKGDRVAACGGADVDVESSFLVIIEVATGIILSTFSGHKDAVRSVAYSPDDSLLISGSEDHTVRLWDTKTGGLMKTLCLNDRVQSVGFSHDGSMIACEAGIWDRNLEEVVRRFDEGVSCLAWSPIRDEITLCYENGEIRVLDVFNGTYRDMASFHTDPVSFLAYTRDGARVASSFGVWKDKIKIHNVDSGKVLQGIDMSAESVCFSPEGDRLFIAQGKSLVIHDLASSTDVAQFEQLYITTSVSVSPDGQSIALADWDKLSIWQMNGSMRSSEATTRHSYVVNSVAISPDSSFIASGSDDSTVKLWDFATGTCTHTFEGHSDWVICVAISPDSTLVASGSADNTIQIWRVADHALICTLNGHNDWVTGVAFSPDGQQIASVSRDGAVRLWDIKEESTVGILEGTGFKGHGTGIRFSADGTGITVFNVQKSKSWKMAASSASSADLKQYPVSFVSHDQPFDNQPSPFYQNDRSSQWITGPHGVRICWLPQDLRNRDQVFDCKGSKFAMGSSSGRVLWFDFGPSQYH